MMTIHKRFNGKVPPELGQDWRAEPLPSFFKF